MSFYDIGIFVVAFRAAFASSCYYYVRVPMLSGYK